MSDPYKKAKKIVKKKKEFYGHVMAYASTNAVMFLVVFLNGGGFAWLIPAGFWGIGLISHYFSVFGMPGTGAGSKEWEEREIRKELEKQGYVLEDEYDELELEELEKREETIYLDEDIV